MPYSNNKNNDYGDSYNYKQKNSNYTDIYSKSKGSKIKPRKKIKNIIIILLCAIFLVAGSFLIYAYNSLSSLNYTDDTSSDLNGFGDIEDIELDFNGNQLLSDPMILNILLFGSDSYSAGDGGRSDSILMVSIDNRHKKLKVTSFLRDIYVQIPGYGEDRLNSAYALGGPALAVKTIEANFGVYVDRYVVADFPGFESIINRIGGIDIYLTAEECEYINTHCDDPNKLTVEDGFHHLTGLQALNHARNRDSAMSDFDRTTRQRDVLSVVVEQMKDASIPQIIGIISDVGPMITTNLKKNEIAILASNSLTYLNYPVDEYSIPNIEEGNFEDIITPEGAMVLGIVDMQQARYDLAQFIFEDSIKLDSTSTIY